MNKNIFFILIIVIIGFANPTYNEMLDIGDKYMKIGRFEEAEKVFEAMYMDFPKDDKVVANLKTVYFALNKTDKLTDILTRQAELEPKNPGVRLDLGKVFTLRGDPDKAMKFFKEAFVLRPEIQAFYEQAFEILANKGYYDQAKAVVKLARKNLDKDSALAIKMALVYEIEGNFDQGMEEYAKYIEEFPDRFMEIERRIDISGSTPEDLAKIEKAIDKVFSDGIFSKTRVFRLLSRLNLRLENYEKALDNLIDAEDADKKAKDGSYVFPFANQMLTQKHLEAAELAGDYLSKTKDAYADRGLLVKADAIYFQNRVEESEKIYESLSDSKIHDVKVQAILKLAEIALSRKQHDKAQAKLKIVLKSRNANLIKKAILLLTKSYLAQDKLDEISGLLDSQKDSFRDQGWYLFEFAELNLFRKEFTDAQDNFNLTIARASESPEANEAVEYLLLMPHKDTPLFERYIAYRKVKKSTGDGIEILKEISKQSSPFRDKLIYELALHYKEKSQFDLAKSTATIGSKEFPNSFYAPFCLEVQADILIIQAQEELAMQIYNEILMDFSDYIHISRIREKANR